MLNRGTIHRATDKWTACALAFKIAADPYVGKLTYFRIYSADSRLVPRFSMLERQKERKHQTAQNACQHREEIEEAGAGNCG
jgi:elongation factor G